MMIITLFRKPTQITTLTNQTVIFLEWKRCWLYEPQFLHTPETDVSKLCFRNHTYFFTSKNPGRVSLRLNYVDFKRTLRRKNWLSGSTKTATIKSLVRTSSDYDIELNSRRCYVGSDCRKLFLGVPQLNFYQTIELYVSLNRS